MFCTTSIQVKRSSSPLISHKFFFTYTSKKQGVDGELKTMCAFTKPCCATIIVFEIHSSISKLKYDGLRFQFYGFIFLNNDIKNWRDFHHFSQKRRKFTDIADVLILTLMTEGCARIYIKNNIPVWWLETRQIWKKYRSQLTE